MEIASTKVILPRRPATLLRRQRLIDFLLAQADKRLVLLSAPAGYGKTSLLLDYAEATAAPVAWFSADEDDRDLRSFGEYLLSAIRHAFPLAGRTTDALLQSTRGAPDPMVLAERLAADLRALPDAVNLVIDDYHLVDQSADVGRFLAALLTRLPPGVRLVLVGRTIPSLTPETLSLLAAQGLVAGIGPAELRFSVDEVRELFEQCFNLHLPETEIQRLAAETEGWIAGIRLTTHTLWQGLLRDVLASRGKENLYTYLANQVLEQQTDDIQSFLLSTCVLQEMEAAVCDALLDRTDSADTLRLLENRSLFVVRTEAGEAPRWRYHPLFASFLQHRLAADPAKEAELHGRAGDVFSSRGQLDPAVRHYLAASQPEAAARMIERNARQVYEAGHFLTLSGWLDSLPAEVLEQRPHLLRLRGKILVDQGKAQEALGWLNQARRGFAGAGDRDGSARAQVEEAEAQRMLNRLPESAALTRDVLEREDKAVDPTVVAKAYRNLGITLCQMGESGEGIGALRQALAGHSELGDIFSVGLTHHDLGVALRRAGDLAASEYHFQQALVRFDQAGDQSRAANTLNSLGFGLHLQGKYEEALQVYVRAQEKAQQAGLMRTLAAVIMGRGDVYRDQGRFGEAASAYDEARQVVEQLEAFGQVLNLLIAQGNLYRLRNDMLRAAALLRRAYEEARERNAEFEKAQAALSLGIVHCEQGNLGTARDYFEEARAVYARMGTRHELARVYLYQARLASLEGKQSTVLSLLTELFRATLELGTHAFLTPDARRLLPMLRYAQSKKVGGEALTALIKRAEAAQPGGQGAEAKVSFPGALPQSIRVYALGQPRVYRGEAALTADEWRAGKVRELLFYLLFKGECRREDIGLALWPDATTAQVVDVFHVTVHRLRRALGAPEWVLFRGDAYLLNRQLPFWYDVQEFQTQLQAARDLAATSPAEALLRYSGAVELYQGEFLGDEVPEWALPFQRRLAEQFEDALRVLANMNMDQGRLEEGIACYQRLLERDFFREDVHREVMAAYAASGQPERAQDHYRRFQRHLRQELDVDPEPATQELYQRVRAGQSAARPTVRSRDISSHN